MTTISKGTALLAFSLMLFASAAFADVPQALTYRGVLLRSTGERKAEALSLTFRIYDSKAPETALWARTLRVPVDADGVFYAELNDKEGNDPDGIGRSLADAMGLVKGAPEIGLTPPDANELKPRQRLSTAPRAARAARTSAADVVYAPAGAVAGGVFIDSAAVGSVTVQEGATLKAFPKDVLQDIGEVGLGQAEQGEGHFLPLDAALHLGIYLSPTAEPEALVDAGLGEVVAVVAAQQTLDAQTVAER